MGGSSSSPLDIVAGVSTGGLYTIFDTANDARLNAKRAMRTAADQQKDAMLAQEGEVKKNQKESKNTANNIAIRNRLIARRGYARGNDRSGTLLTSPAGLPVDGGPGVKTLLGT